MSTTDTTSTPSTSGPPSNTGLVPSHSDAYTTPTSTSAPDNNNNNNNNNNTNRAGVASYYFVSIAVVFVVVFLAAWFVLRKRRLAMAQVPTYRRRASSRNGTQPGPAGGGGRDTFGLGALMRRDGGRGGAVEDREGLNERGEAPPPYKPRDEEEGAGGDLREENMQLPEVAVPMRTLGREEVGLKPPDYAEALTRDTEEERNAAGLGTSGSAAATSPDRRP